MTSQRRDEPIGDTPAWDRADGRPACKRASQEADIWWGAYAGRAMLPSFAICIVWFFALALGAWYLTSYRGMDRLAVRYTAYGLIGIVWGAQLARWAYRLTTYSYRLTNYRLLLERNFVRSGRAEVELRQVSGIAVKRNFLDRLLGVGTIRIVTEREDLPVLTLREVTNPDHVVEKIRTLVKQVRERDAVVVPEPDPGALPLGAGHIEGDV